MLGCMVPYAGFAMLLFSRFQHFKNFAILKCWDVALVESIDTKYQSFCNEEELFFETELFFDKEVALVTRKGKTPSFETNFDRMPYG